MLKLEIAEIELALLAAGIPCQLQTKDGQEVEVTPLKSSDYKISISAKLKVREG